MDVVATPRDDYTVIFRWFTVRRIVRRVFCAAGTLLLLPLLLLRVCVRDGDVA